MLKTIKNLSFVMLFGFSLMSPQAAFSMDAQSDKNAGSSGTSLPTAYRSTKVATNELLDQDPIKNFAYQAKGQAKESKCKCTECDKHFNDAKSLWKSIRNADTSSPETKTLVQNFINEAKFRLSPEMKNWISSKGFTVQASEPLRFNSFISLLALLSILSEGSTDDMTEITLVVPSSGNSTQNPMDKGSK